MNNIENLLSETLSKMKSMIDITTIVGTPISMQDNSIIIPISKASIGLVVGGGELDNKSRGNYPFAGGTGAGINITPSGFLVFSNGKWEFCNANITNNYSDLVNAFSSVFNALVGGENQDEKEQ